jgi:hypothetical protein
MIAGRIYRAGFLPVLLAIVVAAFSISAPARPLTSPLSPDILTGPATLLQNLTKLATAFPDRRPGSQGDDALANAVADSFRSAAPPAKASGSASQAPVYAVSEHSFSARTIDGTRTLETVTATKPGSSSSQIVILANRDAAVPGSKAALSGTYMLTELAQLFAGSIFTHTITFVSTSGGTGGDAGAADLIAHSTQPIDAVIVLGDLAGAQAHRPFVLPWSDAVGGAPPQLRSTVEGAINGQTGAGSSPPSMASQIAHLAFPLTVGAQGVINAAGVPAVLVQVSGERGPTPDDPVPSGNRLQNLGRGILVAVSALDRGHDIASTSPGLLVKGQVLSAWAVRLLVGTLLLPALLASIDACARVRRWKEPLGRWMVWSASCALPFLVSMVFVVMLRLLGLIHAPGTPTLPLDLPLDGSGKAALAATLVVFVLCWIGRSLWRRGRGGERPEAAAGAAVLLLLVGAAVLVWIANPWAAALLVPAVHLWILVADPHLRPPRLVGILLVLVGLLLPALVAILYAHEFGLGLLQVAWMALGLVAGGHLGVLADVGASLLLGAAAATLLLVLQGVPEQVPPEAITVRGPLSYAGPGSLGGTESALRS